MPICTQEKSSRYFFRPVLQVPVLDFPLPPPSPQRWGWTRRVSSVRGLWVIARPPVVSAQRTQQDPGLLESISCWSCHLWPKVVLGEGPAPRHVREDPIHGLDGLLAWVQSRVVLFQEVSEDARSRRVSLLGRVNPDPDYPKLHNYKLSSFF